MNNSNWNPTKIIELSEQEADMMMREIIEQKFYELEEECNRNEIHFLDIDSNIIKCYKPIDITSHQINFNNIWKILNIEYEICYRGYTFLIRKK